MTPMPWSREARCLALRTDSPESPPALLCGLRPPGALSDVRFVYRVGILHGAVRGTTR
jgi:hypothetical protein